MRRACRIAPVLFAAATPQHTANAQHAQIPANEKPIALFNGVGLKGWEGNIARFWSVANGGRWRHKIPTLTDWQYLVHLVCYFGSTRNLGAFLSADEMAAWTDGCGDLVRIEWLKIPYDTGRDYCVKVDCLWYG